MTVGLASNLHGSIEVFGGNAYARARRKIAALVTAVNAPEMMVVQTCAGFSQFYRGLPEGTTISVEVSLGHHVVCLWLRVRLESELADMLAAATIYFSPHVEFGSTAELAHLSLEKKFSISSPPDLDRINRILDARTGEELRSDISKAQQRIDQSQSLIDSYQKELSIAAIIQRELLPSLTDLTPNDCLDAFGFVVPSKEVAGDFYDIIDLSNLDTLLVVGDVSGKGLPSALMMSTCLTLIRAYSEFINVPSIIASKVNDRLVAQNETCMFTTLLIVYLDGGGDELVYCNAGHNPAFLVRESGDIELLDEVHGPAVGFMEGVAYIESRLPFRRGDRLFLYTDGVSEAFNERGELFGYQRIRDFLSARGLAKEPSRQFLDGFFQQLNGFIGAEPAHDDITLLTAYKAPSHLFPIRTQGQSFHHKLANNAAGLEAAKLAVRQFCKETGTLDLVEPKLQIILDEMITNVINHGVAPVGETVEIDLVLVAKNGRLNVQLIDNTQAFDPFSVAEPDLEVDLDDRAIGGLGIYLVRQLTDLFHYERVSGRNVVVLEVMMAPVHDTPSD